MTGVASRSRLFHAIVVVGLSTTSAGCGASGQTVANKDSGPLAPGQATADAVAPDAAGTADSPSEVGSGVFLGTDASEDAGRAIPRGDAGDAAPDCSPVFLPGPEGGCWPIYV
jgi:hypothetical protein